jgi:hypothetical protein
MKNLSLSILLVFVNFFTVGCAETKISQCQKIINITQKIAQESEKFRQTKDIKQVLKMADAFETVAKEMQALKLKDEQLVQYKTGFIDVYKGNAEVTRKFIKAFEDKDMMAAKLMQKQVQIIGQKEQQLVTDMNRYCQE